MEDRLTQMQLLERHRRQLAELEQYVLAVGIDCPEELLRSIKQTRAIIANLEVTMAPEPPAPTLPLPSDLARQPALTLPQHIIWGPDGKEMVLVPSGPFLFGGNQSTRRHEQPAHEVLLPAYYIDRAPVTIGDYAPFVAATGATWPNIFGPRWSPLGYEPFPITGVSWHAARAYAAWAGKRLPTEPEWEKAASGDWATRTKRRYPWGDEWDPRRCNVSGSGIGRLTPVGAYSLYGDAPCGAVDMAGNVFEWTSSLDWNYPYQHGDGRNDPERYGIRVRRGGAYTAEEIFARTTTRYIAEPDGAFITDGFRCVADVTL